MKKLFSLLSIIVIFFLVACGSNGGNNEESLLDESTPLDVELVVPEHAEVNEEVIFTSIVTQGNDKVEDADEVVYEIWEDGKKEESKMIEASEQDGHHYLLTHSFSEEGIYYVQTHVTARGLHTMPTKMIVIGDVEIEEGHEPDIESHGHHDHHGHHDDDDEHHHE